MRIDRVGRRTRLLAGCLLMLMSGACSERRADETRQRFELPLGIHVVSFEIPIGWEHVDKGDEHRFTKEGAHVVLALKYTYYADRLSDPEDPGLEKNLPRLLPRTSSASQNEIYSVEHAVVEGMPRLEVGTWHRMSHTNRKRHVMIATTHATLVMIWNDLGSLENAQPALAMLLDTLEIRDASRATARRAGDSHSIAPGQERS